MNKRRKGLPASPGIAIGPIWLYQPQQIQIEQTTVTDVEAEVGRLETALQEAVSQLKGLEKKALQEIGEAEAEIFAAHQMFLADPELMKAMQSGIREESINAEAAVESAIEAAAKDLEALEDEYFQARALDIRDVGKRVIRILLGMETEVKDFPNHGVVIFADDLTPSDTVQFDRSKILGLATVRGGATSHTAILARSMGVPAIVSAKLEMDELDGAKTAILDGENGVIILDPDTSMQTEYEQRQAQWQEEQVSELAEAHKPAHTRDGIDVEIVANIGGLEDARQALEYGAEGVGLFRTEFLYLDTNVLPDEEQQTQAYREIFDVMEGKPVVVRTLDIGGDKEVPYLGFSNEANPFLGWRAIRMLDEHESVLLTQYRALLRAGIESDLRIMVPMVSRLTEVEQARGLLLKAQKSLEGEGTPHSRDFQFGIMIEVPSVIMILEHIAPLVDFFSIGTNDLTQYTMAVDRTNERVAAIATPFHPSVLQFIHLTIAAAHKHGKWVGVCGEFASNKLAIPFLLGLGLDEYSMSPTAIPGIKALVRKLSQEDCKDVAARALKLPKSEAVKAYLQNVLEDAANA